MFTISNIKDIKTGETFRIGMISRTEVMVKIGSKEGETFSIIEDTFRVTEGNFQSREKFQNSRGNNQTQGNK